MRLLLPDQLREPLDSLSVAAAFRARKRLHVDLRNTIWVSPLGVVSLLSACLSSQTRNLDVTVTLPRDVRARTYLAAVGFIDELTTEGWLTSGALAVDDGYSIQPYLPVTRVVDERDIDAISDQVSESMLRAGSAANLPERVVVVLSELTANAREHGSRCYAMAQMYTGHGRHTDSGIEVAVADFGPGFASTLRANYGPMDDRTALLKGFEENVTGTSRPRERGMGLTYVIEYIDSHPGASLCMVSRKAHIIRQDAAFESAPNIDFRGTIASAYFPISRALI